MDNRRQRRIPLTARATVKKLIGGDKIEAELVNISNFGACLKISTPLKVKEKIKVSIKVNEKDMVVNTEEVLATVRWVNGSGKDSTAGIMFSIKISDNGFPLFSRCLDYLKTHE